MWAKPKSHKYYIHFNNRACSPLLWKTSKQTHTETLYTQLHVRTHQTNSENRSDNVTWEHIFPQLTPNKLLIVRHCFLPWPRRPPWVCGYLLLWQPLARCRLSANPPKCCEKKEDFFFLFCFSFCCRGTVTAEGKPPSPFQSTAPLLQGTQSQLKALRLTSAVLALSLIKVCVFLTGKTTVKTTNLHLNDTFKRDLHLMVKSWDPDHRPNVISCSWARRLSARKTLIGCFTDADGHQRGEANLWLTTISSGQCALK